MTTIFEQSQLAEAAYADFSNPAVTDVDALKAKEFSATQAAEFAAKYRIISHTSNAASGFSATVFEDIYTHKRTVAVRGTELSNLGDLDADLNDIRMQGIALTQAIDLYNYRRSLESGASRNYMAVTLNTDAAKTVLMVAAARAGVGAWNALRLVYEAQGYWVGADSTVSTLGFAVASDVYPADSPLAHRQSESLSNNYDVVGHSLGPINNSAANDRAWKVAA